jgi:hypothetical protein
VARGKADGISGREAMARYGHLFRAGDLTQWRTACSFLGRPLRAWKVGSKCLPGGEWRHDEDDLAEIARTLGEDPDRPHKDPTTGALYLPLQPFLRLTGWVEQQVANYRDDREHVALGRKLDWLKVARPMRRNRHAEIYVYAVRDGERIKQWREAGGKPGRPRKGPQSLPVGGKVIPAAGGAHPQAGAENRTRHRHGGPDALPQQAYPVYIPPEHLPLKVVVQDLSPPPPPPAVVLGANWQEVALVRNKPKALPSFAAWKLLKAILESPGLNLSKQQAENVVPSARAIIYKLEEDPDWRAVILHGRRGAGYGLASR